MASEPLPPRQNRPLLVGMVFVAAAISFWIVLSKSSPPVVEEEEETPAGAGGYAAGAPGGQQAEPPSSPAPRAAQVHREAPGDGVLRVLVLGDEQSRAWAPKTAEVLEDRIQASGGRWEKVRVELSVAAEPGWTAAEAFHYLEDGGWKSERPELVLVSLGWHDGKSADRPDPERPVDGAATWLAELAELSVLRDIQGTESHFYLRNVVSGPDAGRLPPLRHLEYLDAIGLRGAEHGAAVLYVEQPGRHDLESRKVFATTAMRPQPWISTVFAIEQQADPTAFFKASSPIALSDVGASALGNFVALGAVPAVISPAP